MSTAFVIAIVALGLLGLLAIARLARVIGPPRWSRDKLLRRLQIGGVALAGLLALGVALTAQRVDTLRSSAAALADLPNAPGIDAPCIDDAKVADALQRTATVDGVLRRAWLPWSLWADAPNQALVQRVSERVLAQTLLPALACKLNVRIAHMASTPPSRSAAAGYSATRQALLARADEAVTLEGQLADFALLTGADADAAHKLAALNRLLPALLELPAQPTDAATLLGRALASAGYPATAQRISTSRETLAQRIVDRLTPLPGLLQRALLAESGAGPTLLAALTTPRDTLRADTQAFARWLAWISTEWLPFDAVRNPCARLAAELSSKFAALHLPARAQAQLASELKQLSTPEQCVAPIRNSLTKMQLAAHQLVSGEAGQAALSPAWAIELRGLQALDAQAFMKADGPQALACVKGASGWRPTEIAAALSYAREYQQFSTAQGLGPLGTPDDKRPLFDRVARIQLERVMNGAMGTAQTPAATPAPHATAPVDQGMLQASVDFTEALSFLLPVQHLYVQLRLDRSAADLTQCLRDFAFDALQRVKALAAASQLYAPGPGSAGQLLDLGSTALVRDYLARQLARIVVLVSYAHPFVVLLGNSAAVNDGQPDADQIQSYWANTANELQRYVYKKDSTGQVGQLEALLL